MLQIGLKCNAMAKGFYANYHFRCPKNAATMCRIVPQMAIQGLVTHFSGSAVPKKGSLTV